MILQLVLRWTPWILFNHFFMMILCFRNWCICNLWYRIFLHWNIRNIFFGSGFYGSCNLSILIVLLLISPSLSLELPLSSLCATGSSNNFCSCIILCTFCLRRNIRNTFWGILFSCRCSRLSFFWWWRSRWCCFAGDAARGRVLARRVGRIVGRGGAGSGWIFMFGWGPSTFQGGGRLVGTCKWTLAGRTSSYSKVFLVNLYNLDPNPDLTVAALAWLRIKDLDKKLRKHLIWRVPSFYRKCDLFMIF